MNDTLAEWLAAEETQRRRLAAGPGPGVSRPDQVAGRSGLELMQGLLNAELPFPTIGQTLDFLLIEVSHGRAVFQGTPGPAHLNPMGGVHGGWYATLLDSALGCCVHAALPAGKAYTTLELKVNLIRARPGRARGQPDRHGRGAAGGRRRQAVRARHHHLPRVRAAAATMNDAGPGPASWWSVAPRYQSARRRRAASPIAARPSAIIA
jgi:uncharacterized protein (TIGR00369 family)